jgi:hypothetical protein
LEFVCCQGCENPWSGKERRLTARNASFAFMFLKGKCHGNSWNKMELIFATLKVPIG